jgi:hypothetical protein
MKSISVFVLMLAGASAAFAQRDFLTNDEVEKVREAQEPNDRLKLYVLFARQRMDQLQQTVSRDKKGRSLEIRQLLEDYNGIIDAIDNVRDDALKHHAALKEGPEAVAAAEKKFVTQLQKIKDSSPSDLDMYDIELSEAIDATNDSLELGGDDMGKRASELITKDAKAKKADEAMIAAEDSKGKATDADSNASSSPAQTQDSKPARKPPTLYRPGEKPPDPTQ